MTCNAMETEGLPLAGNKGERPVVSAMFALFSGGWVLGNQAGFHCGVAVFQLCSLGVRIP